MMRFLKTPLAFSVLMAAMAGPALAGNYAEGDPRPATLTTSASRADITADAQRWLQSAPNQGYPEGDPRAVTRVAGNTRAVVQADTLAWMRSGLAAAQNGEAGADTSRPAYRQAAAEYARLRNGPAFGGLVESPTSKTAVSQAQATR
ncbi:hypothetical protein [Variovorax sp. DT-64]|uniref:hypothetical protein n=1 Tax=Variovorax sp. DT-64 TaxID=3396160 RepID=UPI003F1C3CC8